MYNLNFRHLYYFYLVAREGNIVNAAKLLHVTPQTVSGQLTTFESQIGCQLFDRINKRLYLNSKGKAVFEHASEIFHRGNLLTDIIRNDHEASQQSFTIGITDAIPKVLAYDFFANTMREYPHIKFQFREGSFDTLLSELAVNHIDLVIADRGIAPGTQVSANSYFLGESHLAFFSSDPDIAKGAGFPACLDNRNLLLPGIKSGITLGLTTWFESQHIFPHVVAEFDDSALLKLFGSEGFGVFCAPSAIAEHVEQQYQVIKCGEVPEIKERFYALTGKSQAQHGIVKAVLNEARALLV
ncbi:LysR family transcriptional regulator [Alteromonas sp. AMM-1]|uniref:LysR family transcriptional regulator n=1 Tax=Alteromonas sp. AMM-1 TaxID=3394233 RepID=UPI0039A6EB25